MTRALLEPIAKLREYEANGQGFQRLALLEEREKRFHGMQYGICSA